MCDAATLAEIRALVSKPPAVVRRAYLLLLAELYGLPSLVEALPAPRVQHRKPVRRYRMEGER